MPDSARLPVVERCLDGARLTLPRAVRQVVGEEAAVSADLAGCVLVTPPGLWQEMLPILQECSSANHHATHLFRFYATSEVTVRVDERSRISIPPLHMEWARLGPNSTVVVIALGRTIQIWDPGRLDMLLEVANRRLRDQGTNILRQQLTLLGE